MTPERWQRVKEVFAHASKLDAESQQRCLDDIRGDDAELYAEVISLLAAHQTEKAIIDRPAAEYLPEGALSDDKLWLGKRIGAYELVAKIGSGGMGDVFRARRADAHFEKEVAIKLVRGGYSSDFVLQRFRAERQILANLEHPNIARLLDGGATAEGWPYLVMELIEGQPIDRYCVEAKLSVSARLQLFRDVCAVVSYAHQRLVVHRDLKPSNILVTAQGTIKLLDFGIAKLVQSTPDDVNADATETTLRALTPGFSSPEQILGLQITTASDVYSLGVVLYHLLTGRSPYRSRLSSTQDAIREVCETDPTKPSLANRQTPSQHVLESLDHDLDDIVLMALRKEPQRRYGSVELFSEDIRRYLTGQPVLAHGDRFSYRAGKFLHRHKVQIAAAMLLLLSLLGGIAISTHEARVATDEKQRAERNFARVRKLANSLVFEMHDAIADLPGSTPARKLLVKNALQYLDQLAAENAGDDELNRELAAAYRRVGDIQGGYGGQNEGETNNAIASYRKGVALLERVISKRGANVDALMELGRVLRRFALTEQRAGDIDRAVATGRQAVNVLAQVLASDPSNTQYRHDFVVAESDFCVALTAAGQYDDAFSICNKSVAEQEGLFRAHPDNRKEQRILAVMYARTAQTNQQFFASVTHDEKFLQTAIELQRKVVAMDEKLVDSDANDNLAKRDLAADYGNFGGDLFLSRDLPGAIEQYSRGINLLAKLAAGDPENISTHIDVALLERNLADVYVAAKQSAHAFETANAALKILNALSPQQMTNLAESERASAIVSIAHAHALVAVRAHQAVAVQLSEWRAAKHGYEDGLERLEAQRAHGGLEANYLADIGNVAKDLETAKAAIAKLTAAK